METVPQLFTQWAAMIWIAKDPNATLNVGHHIGLLQGLSISTSTITIVNSLITFVSFHRRSHFVSPRYPAVASLVPLHLYLLTAVTAATIHPRFMNTNDYVARALDPYGGLLQMCISANGLFAILILCLPCRPRRCWRLIRSIIHVVFVGVPILCFVAIIVDKGRGWDAYLRFISALSLFRLFCVCCVVNLISGILTLPSRELAPQCFTPLLVFVVEIVRQVIVRCCCPLKWRSKLEAVLDGVVRVDGMGEEQAENIDDTAVKRGDRGEDQVEKADETVSAVVRHDDIEEDEGGRVEIREDVGDNQMGHVNELAIDVVKLEAIEESQVVHEDETLKAVVKPEEIEDKLAFTDVMPNDERDEKADEVVPVEKLSNQQVQNELAYINELFNQDVLGEAVEVASTWL